MVIDHNYRLNYLYKQFKTINANTNISEDGMAMMTSLFASNKVAELEAA